MTTAKTAFPGFASPAAGFEAPLGMLSACHGRVESQCQTLLRLVPHLAQNGADQAAREAAQSVMRYFDTSARHHHADEEEDLFPALLRLAPANELTQLRELIAMLQAQHRELERIWADLRLKLESVSLGRTRELDASEVERMAGLYRSHIAREEQDLLPCAARILGIAQLDGVGRAMRARRGIKEI